MKSNRLARKVASEARSRKRFRRTGIRRMRGRASWNPSEEGFSELDVRERWARIRSIRSTHKARRGGEARRVARRKGVEEGWLGFSDRRNAPLGEGETDAVEGLRRVDQRDRARQGVPDEPALVDVPADDHRPLQDLAGPAPRHADLTGDEDEAGV